MPRKRRHTEHENHERWLISYADFITLLFAFFVVMFASSQADKSKVRAVSDSVKSAMEAGGVAALVREMRGETAKEAVRAADTTSVTDLSPSVNYLTEELAKEIQDGKVEVHLESRGMVVTLRQEAFFPSGGDEIAPATYESIAKIAEVLRKLPNAVQIEGHTDSKPIHNGQFHNNWELSTARSIAMLEILTDKYGLPQSKFAVAGYADTVPVDSNETDEGREHNRRVDLVILNQHVLGK